MGIGTGPSPPGKAPAASGLPVGGRSWPEMARISGETRPQASVLCEPYMNTVDRPLSHRGSGGPFPRPSCPGPCTSTTTSWQTPVTAQLTNVLTGSAMRFDQVASDRERNPPSSVSGYLTGHSGDRMSVPLSLAQCQGKRGGRKPDQREQDEIRHPWTH